jgi:hypothetical protein
LTLEKTAEVNKNGPAVTSVMGGGIEFGRRLKIFEAISKNRDGSSKNMREYSILSLSYQCNLLFYIWYSGRGLFERRIVRTMFKQKGFRRCVDTYSSVPEVARCLIPGLRINVLSVESYVNFHITTTIATHGPEKYFSPRKAPHKLRKKLNQR